MNRNCWEVKECGRHVGGKNARDKGVCPASMEVRLDGVHGGKNAGRSCWVVAGTLCDGEEQGTFARKFSDCEDCDFYRAVKKEEGSEFVYSSTLLSRLK